MFSQISAKGRLKSVPSPERLLTSACTFSASWRRALRTGTGNLQLRSSGCSSQASLRACEGFMNPRARGAANYIVTIDGSGKRDAGVKVFRKSRRKLAQLFEREPVEFASFIEREPDRLADDVVRATKGNAAMGQVRGGSHSVEESALCRIFHGFQAKYQPLRE